MDVYLLYLTFKKSKLELRRKIGGTHAQRHNNGCSRQRFS
jgi:hypothetical protein